LAHTKKKLKSISEQGEQSQANQNLLFIYFIIILFSFHFGNKNKDFLIIPTQLRWEKKCQVILHYLRTHTAPPSFRPGKWQTTFLELSALQAAGLEQN
jgi:hypothetical protein